jgi:hypothetical protein
VNVALGYAIAPFLLHGGFDSGAILFQSGDKPA